MLSIVATAPARIAAQPSPRWLAAWGASQNLRETAPSVSNRTVRMVVRPTISGIALRIKLENTLGQSPVEFASVAVGRRDSGATMLPQSAVALTFRGRANVTLQPGDGIWSDSVAFRVDAMQELLVSVQVTSAADISTHSLGLTRGFIADGFRSPTDGGDAFTRTPTRAARTTVDAFPIYWVAGVDVYSADANGAVVGFGDSITDGRCSTTENRVVLPDRYQRWTDLVAERFATRPPAARKAWANAAIAGNRIVTPGGNGPTAVERLDRDVLSRVGVTHVVFFEGTNDLNGGATAEQVIAATQQVIDRVHAKGIAIIGVTVVPRGRPDSVSGWTAAMETHRLAVNAWIRTSAAFDGVIDFDRVLTGGPVSGNGQSIKPEFNCDNIHPNAAGYRAMSEAVDLSLFDRQLTARPHRSP